MADKEEKKAPEAASEAPKEGKEHHPKLGKMTLEQINSALAKAEKNMGGLHSNYARFLLDRKKALSQK